MLVLRLLVCSTNYRVLYPSNRVWERITVLVSVNVHVAIGAFVAETDIGRVGSIITQWVIVQHNACDANSTTRLDLILNSPAGNHIHIWGCPVVAIVWVLGVRCGKSWAGKCEGKEKATGEQGKHHKKATNV